jgi:hypothetical protein
VKMVLRPFMVGNDHFFGRGICVEQTRRGCWPTSRHERKAMKGRRGSSRAVEASAPLLSSSRFSGVLVERLRCAYEHSLIHETGEARFTACQRVWTPTDCHSGLLRFSVNELNMMLKLMLILSFSLALASTECCR